MQRILSQNVDCSDLLQEDTPCRSILVSDHRAFSFLVVSFDCIFNFKYDNNNNNNKNTHSKSDRLTPNGFVNHKHPGFLIMFGCQDPTMAV